MEQTNPSNLKMAKAIQDAALLNLNNDIQDLYKFIKESKNEHSVSVKKEFISVKENIEALQMALKTVPQTFDHDFSSKMNKIVDAANEIDLHSKKLGKTLKMDMSQSVSDQAELLAKEFNNRLKEQTLISKWTLLKFGIYCTMVGGFLSTVLASWFVWVVFPKIF